MGKLLNKLPPICPKIRRMTKSSQLDFSHKKTMMRGSSDNISCYICNITIARDDLDKTVNILSDVTSRRNNVSNVLGTILKTTYIAENKSILCTSCYASIDHYDNLHAELSSIETEMLRILATTQQEREARYLYGELCQKEMDKQVWLSRVSVRLTSDSAQFESLLVDLISKDLPTQLTGNILIASKLPETDLFVKESEFQSLGFRLSDLDAQPIVPLDQILQLSPQFSLSSHQKLTVQISSKSLVDNSSEGRKLHCQKCHFVTNYFYLLLPHLVTHLQEEDLDETLDTDVSDENNVKLDCHQCGKIFKKTEVLEAHVKKVHQGVKAPWICSFCEKGFTRKASLEEHISRHQGVKQRYCEICDKNFYHTAYWRHVATVHAKKEKLKHSCPHCSKVFALKFKLDVHIQSHMNHTDKKYSCDECPDKRFASDEKLKNHKRSVHSKVEASHLCGECGASFSNYPALYQHNKRSHENSIPQPVPCTECTQSFQSERSLLVHRNDHHNKKPFICGFDLCDKGFLSIKHLQHHQLLKHKGAIEEVDEGDNIIYMGDIQDNGESHQSCVDNTQAVDLSRESVTSMDESSSHQVLSLENGACLSNYPGHIVTEYCNNESQEIFMHTETEGQEATHHIDKQEFTTEFENIVNIDMNEQNTIILTEDQGKELIKALNIEMDDDSKIYPCSFCENTYRNERSRTIHLKSVHLNEKPFQCPVCEKAFACQNYLTEHRKIHFCMDRFRCSLCDKTFSSNKVLKRHFRIHTGEKPFKCEYCEKRFAAASNLSEHRTLHTGRMPYTCTGCGGKFRLWTTLKKHTVKCDGVDPVGFKEKGKVTRESTVEGLKQMEGMTQVLVVDGGCKEERRDENCLIHFYKRRS
eukprot:GFUD01033420.1.p1 GENE.GFUD01033420.1~~GFUD01033420.1.p1  ORF type:complete len:904 (+),score=181.26 GFUD01033420.1:107-2713(+)